MINFDTVVTAYHDEQVTLQQPERSKMRERRNFNRERLKNKLSNDYPNLSIDFHVQGSYAMKTMVKDIDNDYDIDDGVYFKKSQLKGLRGGEETALTAKQMVKEALSSGHFAKSPEVRANCVRVLYEVGCHVDVPVYRFDDERNYPELASSSWIRSDSREVTEWFDKRNKQESPDEGNGRQLRRIVRLLKKLARSRQSLKSEMLSGFGITVLVCEQYYPCLGRDDYSFYKTMDNIYKRLLYNKQIPHPITQHSFVNSGVNDQKTNNFLQLLHSSLSDMSSICDEDIDAKEGYKVWDKVFFTNFFSNYFLNLTKNQSIKESLKSNQIIPLDFSSNSHVQNGLDIIAQVQMYGNAQLETIPKNLPHVDPIRWRLQNLITVSITAEEVIYKPVMQTKSIGSGAILNKGTTVNFFCKTKTGFASTFNFEIFWQVVNTCNEAFESDCLRGDFYKSDSNSMHSESTLYCGIHWVEAFLVRKRDSVCVGQSGRFFVLIGPDFEEFN